MINDRWADILDRISERFTIVDRGEEPLPEFPNGKREFVIFRAPMGDVRLERTTKPRVTGERAITSRRAGGAVRVDPVYDLHDLVHFLSASRWDAGTSSWVPIDPAAFG